jgi:hypothetical protein
MSTSGKSREALATTNFRTADEVFDQHSYNQDTGVNVLESGLGICTNDERQKDLTHCLSLRIWRRGGHLLVSDTVFCNAIEGIRVPTFAREGR